MARQAGWRDGQVMRDDHHRCKSVRRRGPRPNAGDPRIGSIPAVAFGRRWPRNAQTCGERCAATLAGVKACEQFSANDDDVSLIDPASLAHAEI